ncbi:MAG: CBS domain-containing protein [Candidatus Binatia bacterium]
MSPRAASRLESLGFEEVLDYVAGKQDWLAFGLPIEGKSADVPTIGQAANRDVQTCYITESVGDVQNRLRQAHEQTCVVVDKDRVVLGLLRKKLWDLGAEIPVEEAIDAGPTTFRPHIALDEMAAYMRDKRLASLLVTTSDGRLVGILRRLK